MIDELVEYHSVFPWLMLNFDQWNLNNVQLMLPDLEPKQILIKKEELSDVMLTMKSNWLDRLDIEEYEVDLNYHI